MKTRIRVGIDGSEASRAAVRWSVRRLATFDNGADKALTLVHVVDDDWGMMGSRNMEALREDGRILAAKEAEYVRSLGTDLAVETEVLIGNPIWELIARSVGETMTVVGTHKTGFIQGRVFGSRSLQLAAAARAPVAIIPQSQPHDSRGIVVGVDGSAAGRAALRFAAEEAARTRQTLVLVRAWRAPKHPNEGEPSLFGDQERAAQKASVELSAAEKLARSIFPSGEIRVRNVGRSPAEALLDASTRASLLVIGGTRRTGGERMVLGSVSHDVLLNLAAPTVVVHADHAE
jgi:nucleotide-binding universal stress UspA family protein